MNQLDDEFDRVIFEMTASGLISMKTGAHMKHVRHQLPCLCRKLGWLVYEEAEYEKVSVEVGA